MKQLYFKNFWYTIANLYSFCLLIFAIYPCRPHNTTVMGIFLFDKVLHLFCYFWLPIVNSIMIKTFWPLISFLFFFSFLTEFLQYLTNCGGVEFLDIISNLIGCASGLIFIVIFPNIIFKIDQQILNLLKK